MTERQPASHTPKIFYGWIMVVVLLLILSVGMGTSIYMYSVVAGAVGEEFGASRLVLMLGSTGLLMMMGLCSPLLGRLLDRHTSRWILVGGALVMGLGFILIALSTHIWMVVASYVVFIGVGAAVLSTLTTSTLLSRWFVRRRGLAIGVATLGTQFGGFVFPPLVAMAMEAYNWRIAVGGLGVLVMLILPVVIWLLVADRPEDKSQHPDGDRLPLSQPGSAPAAAVPAPKISFGTLLSQRNFVLMIFIAGAASATNTVLLANLSLFATDIGEPAVRGALMVSLTALLGIFLSPFFGWLCDIANIKVVTAGVLLFLALSCLLFSVAGNYPMLLVATVCQGIGGAGVFLVWAALVGHLYHVRVYGQVMGASTLFIAAFSAAMPLFGGWIHDVTGTYQPLFLILVVILLVLTLFVPLLRVPRDPQDKFGAPA